MTQLKVTGLDTALWLKQYVQYFNVYITDVSPYRCEVLHYKFSYNTKLVLGSVIQYMLKYKWSWGAFKDANEGQPAYAYLHLTKCEKCNLRNCVKTEAAFLHFKCKVIPPTPEGVRKYPLVEFGL